MKIAIHVREGSYSEGWIAYCQKNNIDYKIVNCYDNNIISLIEDCDVLMWHYHHAIYKDVLFAKQLLFSVEQAGKLVFPNFNTAWHFDDKVGQKYLFESIKAPLVPSYVFYCKESAFSWVKTTSFPKVFKLRGGAGSANVKLVKNKKEAKQIINKAFGKGFPQFDGKSYFFEIFNRFRYGKVNLIKVIRAFGRMLLSTEFSKIIGNERGYVYFQDFIPNNNYDIRIVVVGDKAFGLIRMVRKNDFRASGSGDENFNPDLIPLEALKIAFEVANRINSQCCVFDFVCSENDVLLIEVSYGTTDDHELCPGYWDPKFIFHKGEICLSEIVLEDTINRFSIS